MECKVYIGNLGNNASKYDLEDAFAKYGPLKNVWVARNPPGFAFGKSIPSYLRMVLYLYLPQFKILLVVFASLFNAVELLAFSVEFEDSRDAEDSVRGLDGTRVCGVSIFKN